MIWILLSTLCIIINGQGLWDYNDYNSLLFPPMFGAAPPHPNNNLPFQPNLQRQVQPPIFHQNSFPQHLNPPPSPNSNFQPNHRLGSASYRPSAARVQQTFGQNSGGPYYSGRGNDFVGSSAEKSENHGDLDGLLARIVTRIPAIADQLSQIMSTTTLSPNQNADFWLPFVQPERKNTRVENNVEEEENVGNLVRRAPSTVINSMPDPSAFFSFGKLLNAFTGSGLETPKFDKQVDPEEERIDVESVKGVPILKDEDQESEVIQRPDEELPAAHSLEGTTEITEPPELIIFTIPQNIEEEEKTTIETSTSPKKEEDSDNLLGSLLNGKLDRVDWIGSIFGGKKEANKSEDGNALAQLFSGSGIFGSAMSNDDEKLRKYEDRNFH